MKPEATPCTYDQAAETVRRAMSGMMIETAKMLDRTDLSAIEAVSAIAEGSLAHSIDAYLRLIAVFGVPLGEVRQQLDRSLDSYWKQAVAAHYTEKARRETQSEETKTFPEGGKSA